MFRKLDATQIEINPWAVTPEGELYCVDAKINVDDNAAFRQKHLLEMREKTAASEDLDVNEEKAQAAGLNYIGLDGNIGCMVNGAGLAMATMDIIKNKGGEPANFLDVGGGATVDQVKTAFEILSEHPNVKTILVNIFAGIMKCDTVAEGVIAAAQQVQLEVPLVVRLHGNNSEIAFELVEKFRKDNPGIKIQMAKNLDDAATKAVASLK